MTAFVTSDCVVTDSNFWDDPSIRNAEEYECKERRGNAHDDRESELAIRMKECVLLKTLQNLGYDLQCTVWPFTHLKEAR